MTAHAVREKTLPGIVRRARVIPDLPVWQQLSRVGGGLTPPEVTRRLLEADMGRMAELVDLANALRQRDGHLQGILETRETAVQQLDWELELPKKPTKREKKAAAFVEDAIVDVIAPAIAQCSSAPFYGYAVTETVWRKSSGYLVPECFVPIAHRRFAYEASRLLWREAQGGPGVDIQAEYPGQFIVSRPRVNGDVPCREGLMRVLVWAALFRNWTLADWLRLGEIAWRPWRTGKYKAEETQDNEIEGLIAILDQMSTSGVAVFPDSQEIDVKWPEGVASNGSPHAEMFSTMGREMSKCVLGQTETTEASKSSGYAQAKVQNEVKKDKRDSDARFIAADLTRDLLAWLVHLNFGPKVRVPSLRFITDDAVDLAAFATGVSTLCTAGLRIPAQWARDQAGIPEPVEGEELVSDGKPEPVAPAPAAPGEKPAGPDNEPEGADDVDEAAQ